MSGVVAAGHPLTAEAGAEVLREGGNAVDAAVCAVLASFAVESPLTGFGAGGFMMVHRGEETVLIDFFVAAPGKDGSERGVELAAVPVHFDAETVQTFFVGPASCGVPGTAAGLELALERFGSAPLAELVRPGVCLAREGAPVNAEQAYILEILWPIHERLAETRELYAPRGRPLGAGDVLRFPALGDALERFAAEVPECLTRRGRGGAERLRGASAAARWSDRPGGLRGDRAVPIRAPSRRRGADQPAAFLGRHPRRLHARPAERVGERSGPEQLVAATDAVNAARGEEFAARPLRGGAGASLPDPAQLDLRAGDLLGSTTHIAVARRRRHVRQRHLLERLRPRRAGPRVTMLRKIGVTGLVVMPWQLVPKGERDRPVATIERRLPQLLEEIGVG